MIKDMGSSYFNWFFGWFVEMTFSEKAGLIFIIVMIIITSSYLWVSNLMDISRKVKKTEDDGGSSDVNAEDKKQEKSNNTKNEADKNDKEPVKKDLVNSDTKVSDKGK